MEKFFSIGQAAKMTQMTSETLRHYDRIGLVQPSRVDEWTGYRYYSKQDVVRLHTVRALQRMDLSLQEIKEVLEYDELEEIVDFLNRAEKKAEEKIAALEYSKKKIQSVRAEYEKMLQQRQSATVAFTKEFPERVIMLSQTLQTPTLENLWNYLSHFYDQVDPSQRDDFAFEDLAGIYTEQGKSYLFALCIRYQDADSLKTLPAGTYLCADCTEENREEILRELMQTARERYRASPAFTVQLIVVSGILQWNYQAQVYLGRKNA